jgi:uncharacterized membrane protein
LCRQPYIWIHRIRSVIWIIPRIGPDKGPFVLPSAILLHLGGIIHVLFWLRLMHRANFKTSTFVQSLRQAQILILEIFHIFLRLKFASSLTLNKIKRFETGSKKIFQVATKTRKHKEENCVNLFLGALVPLWQK